MTKKQFMKKYRELVRENNKELLKIGEKAFGCGGIEPSDYEDNYLLPKIVMTAACRKMADQWQPWSSDMPEVDNLKHFI